jgi:lipopolysaccharide export system permease protein
MRFPTRISLYMGAQFLLWLGVGLLVFTSLIFLVDSVEVLRKSATRSVPYSAILLISFLHLPTLLEQVAPFTFLFGAILCFTKLTRTRELVITRASGVSVWQFLFPSIAISMLIGVFIICFFNPLGAMMNAKAAQLEDKYFGNDSGQINFSKSGLWLKQRNESNEGETLITASSISPDSQHFRDLTIFEFDKDKKFTRRIDAHEGMLADDQWAFKDATINKPGQPTEKLPEYKMPTSLSLKQIQESFNSPDTISFWALPEFIQALEESGFSALRHKLYYHSILTTPIMLATMVLIAAVFSLRFSRRGRNGLLISGGVFTGFVFFFISKLTASFGIAGDMPVILAAWTPTLIFILIGIWLLLHLEDG